MQSFFGFGAAPKIELEFTEVTGRKVKKVEMVDGPALMLYQYDSREPLRGRVRVTIPDGKAVEHAGVKVELKGMIGAPVVAAAAGVGVCVPWPAVPPAVRSPPLPLPHRAELYYDRGNLHEFVSVPIQLAGPGVLTGSQVRTSRCAPGAIAARALTARVPSCQCVLCAHMRCDEGMLLCVCACRVRACVCGCACAVQGFSFEFLDINKPYETYNGVNVRCRCVDLIVSRMTRLISERGVVRVRPRARVRVSGCRRCPSGCVCCVRAHVHLRGAFTPLVLLLLCV